MCSGRLIKPGAALAGLRIDVPAELGGDHDLVPERLDGFAENPFAFEGAVCLGSIEKGDAAVVGTCG